MPRIIDLGEHYGPVEFPDDWSDDQVRAAYTQLEEKRKSATPAEYVQQGVGSLVRGVGNVVASVPESIAIQGKLGRRLGVPTIPILANVFPEAYQGAADLIRKGTEAISPAQVPSLQESFLASTVPQGIGSAIGFMAGGVAGRAAKVPTRLATAGLGAAAGTSEFYQDAKAKGADEATAQLAGLIGAAVGTSEALPLSRIMRRLDGMTGGSFSKFVVESGRDTLEEALQEGAQQLAQNFTAQQLYDADRGFWDDVAPNAGAGGITGFLFSALSQAVGHGVNRRNQATLIRRGEERRRTAISQAVDQGQIFQPGGPNAQGTRIETAPPGQPPPGVEPGAEAGLRLRDTTQNGLETTPGAINEATQNQGNALAAALATQAGQVPPAPQGSPQAGGLREPGANAITGGPVVLRLPDVQTAIAPIVSKWLNPPPINIVETVDQLPPEIQSEAEQAGLNLSATRGVANPRSGVWLVASNLSSPEQAARTLLHEVVGHYGVNAILEPADLNAFMQGVAARHADTELGRQVRATYGQDPAVVGREIVAKLAEEPQADPTLWQKIVATVRQWARAVFNLDVSDNDIRVLLSRSAKALREGRTTSVESEGSAFAGQQKIPIKIQRADGTVVDGEFNGYYDLTSLGKAPVASIGWMRDGKMTHGMLAPGERIIGEVPTFEEWKQQRSQFSIGEPGTNPQVFRGRPQVEAAIQNPGLSAEQQKVAEDLAKVQAAMSPDNLVGWLMSPPVDKADAYAQGKLDYIEDRRHLSQTQMPLTVLPTGTEDERRAREVAGATVLAQYGIDRNTERRSLMELEEDQAGLTAAMAKIGKLNAAQIKSNFLTALFNKLVSGYKAYIVNLAKATPAAENNQAAYRQALVDAERRLNEHEASPVAIQQALSHVAKHVPAALLAPGVSNESIISWIVNSGILVGKVSDKTRIWMTVNDGTGQPAMMAYPKLGEDLDTLAEIFSDGDAIEQELKQFEQWFAAGKKEKKVSARRFAEDYFKLRTSRDRAAKVAAKMEKEIEDLDTRIRGNKGVLDRLQQMMTAPDYVSTVRTAAEEADVVVRALHDSQDQKNGLIDRDRTVGRWRMIGPVSGDEYVVDLYPSSAQEKNNRQQLSAFVQEARAYATSYAQANPLLADDYNRLADYIEKFLLHPSMDPSTGFTQTAWANIPGTNVRFTPDPMEWFSSLSGSWFKTIRDTMERIGGRPMRQVITDAYDLDTTMRKVEAVNANPNYGYQAQTAAVRKALESHGWSPELFSVWDERVAEPVLAAGQNNLGPRYEVGDVIIGSGTRLTKEDVDALAIMKRWEDAILAAAPSHVKDKVGDLGITRKAIGSGKFTMARLPAPWTRKFLIAWADAKTPDEKKALITRDDNFRRVVLGYVGEFNPEFLAMNPASGEKSPLFKIYRQLALTEKQGVKSFANLDEVLDFIADEMVAAKMAPDFATARKSAEGTLMGEISSFIKSFEDKVVNYKSSETFGGVPPPVVQTATANNAFTTPRGALIAPSTFYSYSTAADGRRMVHVGGLRSLMNLRVLQSAHEAMAAMEAAKVAMEDRIQRLQLAGKSQKAARSQVIKETAADRKAGQIRYDYLELVNALNLMHQSFGQLERFEASTPDYYEHAGIAALNNFFGSVKTMLLSSPQAVTTNFWSGALLGPALFHWQTGQLVKAIRDVVPAPFGGTALLTKTLMKRIAAMVAKNPAMSSLLRQHSGFFFGLGQAVIDAAQDWRRLEGIAQASGMVTPYNLRETWRNEAELKRTGGRLMDMERNNEMNWVTVANNKFLAAPGIRHVVGMLKATTPRLFDNLINYTMVAAFDRETEFLKKMGWNAFRNREAVAAKTGANYTDLTQPGNILQPGDIGLGSNKALNRYREIFMGLGSLDKVLLDYYERTKSMTPEQRAAEPLIPDESDYAATALQYAGVSNVATESNRPYGTKGKGSDGMWRNIVGTFMGWVSNMVKQFSKVLQTHSGDPQPARTLNNILTLTVTTMLLAAVGAWNWEFGDELTEDLFNVSSARVQPGNIKDPKTALTYFAQALVNTVPVVGSQLGSLAGVAFTGRGNPFDMTSLIPQLGFVSGAYNTLRRMYQTGDVVLPLVDFTRQWVPLSKIVLNRLPGVRGLVDQSNAVRSLNASAPPGTEIKWGRQGGGAVRYGPANDEIQKLIAAAYEVTAHGGSMETVQQRYQEAIAAMVRAGRSPQEAAKTVATALAAKEPIRILTGKEFTPAEEARWLARMTSGQRRDYDTAVQAWQLLSNVTGKDLNMTTTAHVASGGGRGGVVGMSGGLSGGLGRAAIGGRRSRVSSAPQLTQFSAYSPNRAPAIRTPRPQRGRRTRNRSRVPKMRQPRLMRSGGGGGGVGSRGRRSSSLMRRVPIR